MRNSDNPFLSGEIFYGILGGLTVFLLFAFGGYIPKPGIVSFLSTYTITLAGFMFTSYFIMASSDSLIKRVGKLGIKGRTFGVMMLIILELILGSVFTGLLLLFNQKIFFFVGIGLAVSATISSFFVFLWLYKSIS